MTRGRKDKWSRAQIDAVRAKALNGGSARTIHRAIVAGELAGYDGEAMPLGTIKYHAARAREKALDAARETFEPAAIDAQIGAILAGLLKAAELGLVKARRQLRAGDPAGWDTLDRAAKALANVKRVSDMLNPPAKPGHKTPHNPSKANGTSSTPDLVAQLAAATATKTDRQPG